MWKIAVTVLVALMGGYIGVRFKIPAGALIGSMIAVAILNVALDVAYFPASAKFYTQVSTGAFIGAKIGKQDLLDLKKIAKPAVILSAVMLLFTIGISLLICSISELSIATALFATAPAGISDMTLASMDFDAEPAMVALLQTLRVIFALCLLPPLIKRVHRRHPPNVQQEERAEMQGPKKSKVNIALTLLVGLIVGRVGYSLGVPSGSISFSMLGCAMFNILTGRGYMPLRLRQFIQMFAGALIGCTISRTQVLQMLQIYKIVLLIAVGFILLDVVSASLIAKFTEMDLVTAMFACSPGGVTDMAIIADEMGADSVKVAGMQIMRLISIVALYPILISRLVLIL